MLYICELHCCFAKFLNGSCWPSCDLNISVDRKINVTTLVCNRIAYYDQETKYNLVFVREKYLLHCYMSKFK